MLAHLARVSEKVKVVDSNGFLWYNKIKEKNAIEDL